MVEGSVYALVVDGRLFTPDIPGAMSPLLTGRPSDMNVEFGEWVLVQDEGQPILQRPANYRLEGNKVIRSWPKIK